MEQATEDTAGRVTPEQARDIIRGLRTALNAVGVPPFITRQIIPTADATGTTLIRTGTWDLASAVAVTAALAPHQAPLIGRADLPPILPPVV